MSLEERVTIDDESWIIRMTRDGQIYFLFVIPYEKSEWKKDPIWHSFDPDDDIYKDEYVSDLNLSKVDINPFRIKRILIQHIAKLIKRSHHSFFYFEANTQQKGKIYTNLIQELLSNLEPGWTYQVINERWFYFRNAEYLDQN